jgi:hypothetical protein
LQLSWEDFKAVPSHAIIMCVIYPVLGLVLARTVLGYSVLPLLFPLTAGFALLDPFAALGLYELSRRRESCAEATVWDALEVLRSPSKPNSIRRRFRRAPRVSDGPPRISRPICFPGGARIVPRVPEKLMQHTASRPAVWRA